MKANPEQMDLNWAAWEKRLLKLRNLDRPLKALRGSIRAYQKRCLLKHLPPPLERDPQSEFDLNTENCPLCGLYYPPDNFYDLQDCPQCPLGIIGRPCERHPSFWRECTGEVGGMRFRQWANPPGIAFRRMRLVLEKLAEMTRKEIRRRKRAQLKKPKR